MENFVDTCYSELEVKQNKIQEDFDIGSFDEYRYDQEQEILQFKNANEVIIEFNVIFIGTWSKKKKDWLWAWANSSMTDNVKQKALSLKKLHHITGFHIFENSSLEADEITAWELAALSVHVLEAIGLYKIPGDDSDLFIALIEKK